MSRADFFRLFPDDITVEALFEAIRWPDGMICPHCDSDRIARVKNRKPMPLRCKDCRKFFSVRYGTVMQDSNLGLQTWLLVRLPADDQVEGDEQPEAAPRSRRNTENGVVLGPPYPRGDTSGRFVVLRAGRSRRNLCGHYS